MTREQLIQAWHEFTDRPLDDCTRMVDEIPPHELPRILAEAKQMAIAHLEEIERGAFFQVERLQRIAP